MSIKRVAFVAGRDKLIGRGMIVDLRVFVKVTKDWRDKDATLKQFGYDVR